MLINENKCLPQLSGQFVTLLVKGFKLLVMHIRTRFKFIGWLSLMLWASISAAEDTPPSEPVNQSPPAMSEAFEQTLQQRQQLVQQFSQDVETSTSAERIALIGAFRQQLTSLHAALDAQTANITAAISPNESAAPAAAPPPALSGNAEWLSAIQQRQQLTEQLDGASAEQKITLLAQLREQMGQIEQLSQFALPSLAAPAVEELDLQAMHAQALEAAMATLPEIHRVELQTIAHYQQAVQAAAQLSPEQRADALQAARALSPPTTSFENSLSPSVSEP